MEKKNQILDLSFDFALEIHFKTPHGEMDGHLNLLKIKNRLTIFKIFMQYYYLNYRSYLNDISPKSIDKRYFEYE